MIWVFLVITLYLVKKRTKFSFFSPLVLFYLFFLISIILSTAYHYLMPYSWKFNIAQLDRINDIQFWISIRVFVLMLIYFSIGVLFYKYFFKVRKNVNFKFDLKIKLPLIKPDYLVLISLVLIAIDVLLVWILYGKEFFIRDTYSVDYNTAGIMLLEYSLLFLIFLGAILFKDRKFFSSIIAFFVTMLCIGFGSRMATIYLMVYFFVIFILYLSKKKKTIFIAFGTPFILVFFGYNMSLRFNDLHGLGPYLALPFTNPLEIVNNIFFNIYYTFIFGVFAAFKTLVENTPNYDYLLTSINPAPGFLTDWYTIYKKLRINHYAPFTAIGEVFSYPNFAFFFYFFIGMFFAHSEKIIQRLFMNKKAAIGFILFLLTAAFIPYSFEYNLRSSLRFIYYAMFFAFMQNLFSKIKL